MSWKRASFCTIMSATTKSIGSRVQHHSKEVSVYSDRFCSWTFHRTFHNELLSFSEGHLWTFRECRRCCVYVRAVHKLSRPVGNAVVGALRSAVLPIRRSPVQQEVPLFFSIRASVKSVAHLSSRALRGRICSFSIVIKEANE